MKALRTWMQAWMVIFSLGAVAFLATPPMDFWKPLAVAYMVLIAWICFVASRQPEVDLTFVRGLIVAKVASSACALILLLTALHTGGMALIFVVDGLIAAGTYWLLRSVTIAGPKPG